MASNNAQALGETIREAAVKVSRIMELHDRITEIVGDSTEMTQDELAEIAPLFMEQLAELRMCSTRLICVAGALSGHDPLREAEYQASVIAENQILQMLGDAGGFGIIFMDGGDDEQG